MALYFDGRQYRPPSRPVPHRACATVAAMVLLSGMMRSAAVTGRTDTLAAWCAGRQGGRWAQQTVRAAIPTAAPHAKRTSPAGREPDRGDPAEALRELTELQQRGVVTDAEFEALRARLRV
jgi:hypothetical protein